MEHARRKAHLLRRLPLIEGHVRGIKTMLDEDRYCTNVLTQIGAVRSALDKVALGLLDGHTRHCLVRAGRTPMPRATS